jgi:hypothetical protein
MAAYQFQTVWRFEAPSAAVWDALADLEGAAWWPGLAVTVLVRGDRRGVGDVLRYDLRTQLPYTLSFITIMTALERPHRIAVQVGGDLVGTGRWDVEQDGRVTRATYLWTVRTTKRWMNLLAPALRPAFAWNHHRVMVAGARGLAQHLDVRLVEATATVSGR